MYTDHGVDMEGHIDENIVRTATPNVVYKATINYFFNENQLREEEDVDLATYAPKVGVSVARGMYFDYAFMLSGGLRVWRFPQGLRFIRCLLNDVSDSRGYEFQRRATIGVSRAMRK